MTNITSKLIINSVQYEIKDEFARNEIGTLENDVSSLETQVSNLDLEGSDWELKAIYTGASETLNLTIGKVE